MEMLVKKYQSQKLPEKPPKILFQIKARIEIVVRKYHAKVPSKTLAKICFLEKIALTYSSRTFCTKKLLKTPSTTSKHSSEKYRTKVLPTTPSMKRNLKNDQN